MTDKENGQITFFKVKDLKVYGSSEWLANGRKKYRQVFDRAETTYVYAELSFYNKLFDEKDWDIDVCLKAYAIKGSHRRELCNLAFEKKVSKDLNIVCIHQAWGNKKPGFYWKRGVYEWEAYLNGKLVKTKRFWIEDVGIVTNDINPYFSINAIKLYEGPNNNITNDQRVYYKKFDGRDTRYIFVEFTLQNIVKYYAWNCELTFKYYNNAHQLKGETVEVLEIKPKDKEFTITSGWGSNDKGTWFTDRYTVEILFMDRLIAILPFEVCDNFEEGLNETQLPGTGAVLKPDETNVEQTFEEVMQELDALVGLQNIKSRIREYAEYLKFIKIRMEKGIENGHNINLHTVFTGNPGTGKTTVAKMLGKIYKQMGLLSKGHVHEVDRADLVGEYIGQTAPKVKEAIKQARGGILFIDEAYSLARAKDDVKDFGREVIEIIIREMSDGEGDLSVVVAGYPQEIKTFMDTNPGLKSRFTQWFNFPDYMPPELIKIADHAATKRKVLLSHQCRAFLFDKIVDAYRNRNRYFGNARYIYSLIDQAKINLGLRIMKGEEPRRLNNEELSTIIVDDLEPLFTEKSQKLPDIPVEEKLLEESLAELYAMTGLDSVKKDIEELVQLVRFYREEGREVLNKFSLHAVFSGNPGTGKTTVARILAKIYKALGILERGHLVECDRQNLVAGYVGQTALKTTAKIDEAIGGVLFIDEAYALTQRGTGDFGQEAVETLIKRMEDQKGEFAIVVAGYPENMKSFMEANPGLKSRFDRVLNFEDFTIDQLLEIVLSVLADEKLTLTNKAAKHVRDYLSMLYNKKDKFFGNGRTVMKMVKEIIKRQNLRLSLITQKDRTRRMLQTITLEDVKSFNDKKALTGGKKKIGFTQMGQAAGNA